jgi:small subunit ribosomal protein S17
MADENVNETEGASADAGALEEQAAVEPVPAEEAVAEAPAAEEEADEPAAEPLAEAEVEAPAAEADAAPAEPQAGSPSASPKAKRKRLPRPLRRQRTGVKRVKAAERKPIVRLEKPEHERGRRQERQGTVVSDAMEKTIVVRVDVVKAHPRYKKVVRRSVKFHAHDENGQAKVGDVVRIVETRPLSKTKRWRLAEVVEAAK